MARYGRGKTKGYQNLKDRSLVPPPVMTHPDRRRLDQLLAYEEKRIALAEAALDALLTHERAQVAISDLLPQAAAALSVMDAFPAQHAGQATTRRHSHRGGRRALFRGCGLAW